MATLLYGQMSVIEGVTYPREVPVPAGLPAGWKGIEKASDAAVRSVPVSVNPVCDKPNIGSVWFGTVGETGSFRSGSKSV